MDIVNIYDNYNSYFNADLKAIFERCSKIAAKNNLKIFLIGGLVRDLLLHSRVIASNAKQSNKINDLKLGCNISFLDIDITIEGDAIEFANILKNEAGAKIESIHADFGTAKIKINNQEIDLASTRCETYPKKGHLPQVEKFGCSLKEDVSRRDFTINSIALSLNQENFCGIIDYTNGLDDLKNKMVKILHDKSFIDDPTRIIRALKYSTRFNFELDEKTQRLQEEYLSNINYDMCYKRLKNELKKTLNTTNTTYFEKFVSQNIYKLITPKCHAELDSASFQLGIMDKFQNILKKTMPKNPWLVYLGLILINENEEILEKLELTKAEKQIILDAKIILEKNPKTDFEIYKTFKDVALESIAIYGLICDENKVLHYIKNLKNIKLEITGDDIIDLGFKPSKKFTKLFDFLLEEKIKNPKLTKEAELQLAKIHMHKS